MPIPEFKFEDEKKGLPRHPVPVRFACIAANWAPKMFAALVAGEEKLGGPLLDVYEFNGDSRLAGEVHPDCYSMLFSGQENKVVSELEILPINHFVWSDELVLAYSQFVDTTIVREDASTGGMAIRWKPALGDNVSVLEECVDLGSITGNKYSHCFIRSVNDVWSISFNDKMISISDQKGIHYIKVLLLKPRESFTIQDLHLLVNPTFSEVEINVQEFMTMDDEDNAGFSIGGLGNAGTAFDEKTKKQLKSRLSTLDEQIEDAQQKGDEEKYSKLEGDRDKIIIYLSSGQGKGGRTRILGSTDEKIRKSISNSINRAVKHISQYHPELGQHLKHSIRTGSTCSYIPDPDTVWTS